MITQISEKYLYHDIVDTITQQSDEVNKIVNIWT